MAFFFFYYYYFKIIKLEISLFHLYKYMNMFFIIFFSSAIVSNSMKIVFPEAPVLRLIGLETQLFRFDRIQFFFFFFFVRLRPVATSSSSVLVDDKWNIIERKLISLQWHAEKLEVSFEKLVFVTSSKFAQTHIRLFEELLLVWMTIIQNGQTKRPRTKYTALVRHEEPFYFISHHPLLFRCSIIYYRSCLSDPLENLRITESWVFGIKIPTKR